MVLAVDLVQDRLHLETVVTLDIGKAVGPGIAAGYSRLIRQRVAACDGGQRYRNRIDFGRVVVVDIRPVAGPSDRRVGRVLVRPGGVPARGVHDAKNRVGANKIPWIDGSAVVGRVAL